MDHTHDHNNVMWLIMMELTLSFLWQQAKIPIHWKVLCANSSYFLNVLSFFGFLQHVEKREDLFRMLKSQNCCPGSKIILQSKNYNINKPHSRNRRAEWTLYCIHYHLQHNNQLGTYKEGQMRQSNIKGETTSIQRQRGPN